MLTIKELEQKHKELEARLSKVEGCLQDANRRREAFCTDMHKAAEYLRKESARPICVPEEL
jgi:hypothetical protein